MDVIIKLAKSFIDYLVISLLLAVSLALVVPFVYVFVGVTNYFSAPPKERSLKSIFTAIKENIAVLWIYALVVTLLLAISILDIRFLSLPTNWVSVIVLGASWVVLVFGGLFLLMGPVIILKMNVTFKQLILNSVIVLVSGTWKSLLLVAFGAGILYFGLRYPVILVPSLYFLALADYFLVNAMIDNIKRKGKQNYEKTI